MRPGSAHMRPSLHQAVATTLKYGSPCLTRRLGVASMLLRRRRASSRLGGWGTVDPASVSGYDHSAMWFIRPRSIVGYTDRSSLPATPGGVDISQLNDKVGVGMGHKYDTDQLRRRPDMRRRFPAGEETRQRADPFELIHDNWALSRWSGLARSRPLRRA